MSDPAIRLCNVSKRFGKQEVLSSVSLQITKGKIYALLGRNGAGKTTTINILMGLLQPTSGEVSILGLNPERDSLEIRRRVGYMAEDTRMFEWMTVGEICRFLKPFYPKWDSHLAGQYIDRFGLSFDKKIKHLSKGQTVRLSMVLALAHQPELVVLDDPTLGLDPIARKEFLRDVIEHFQGRDTTVFFTSHLLYEIEAIADTVAILHEGRIVCESGTEALRERVKKLVVPKENLEAVLRIGEILDLQPEGIFTAVVVANADQTIPALQEQCIQPRIFDLNLDEIFEAYVIGRRTVEYDSSIALERVV